MQLSPLLPDLWLTLSWLAYLLRTFLLEVSSRSYHGVRPDRTCGQERAFCRFEFGGDLDLDARLRDLKGAVAGALGVGAPAVRGLVVEWGCSAVREVRRGGCRDRCHELCIRSAASPLLNTSQKVPSYYKVYTLVYTVGGPNTYYM